MKTPIPSSADELEQMLGDESVMQKLLESPQDFGQFVQNYARTVYDKDQGIATQVKEETQRLLGNWLKENGQELTKRPDLSPLDTQPNTLKAKGGIYNPRAMGAQIDKEFANSAEYFKTIWHHTDRHGEVQAKLGRIRNAFSSTVPSEGGFLVPENLRAELLRVALETSIVRPRARVVPMESLRVPFPAIDSNSNVSSVYGGVVGYWTEEAATLTQSQASFGRVILDAKKLTAYTEVPNELLSDSIISFQAFIEEIFPEALGFYEDVAFLSGTGVGEPLGVLNSTAQVAVAKEAGQAAATIVAANLFKMYSRMLPGSLSRAVWIVGIDAFPQLATLGAAGGVAWLDNLREAPVMTILGRPVILTEKVPTVGTVGDINFVDLGFYLIGDRQVMSALSSAHYKFANDVTAYRIIERVDGRPWLNSAITPKNNTSTLSPVVKLATRA